MTLKIFLLAQSESNDEIINDCNQKIDKIKKDIKDKEINCFLSGENDDLSIYLEIHAGAGELRARIGQICSEECI